MLKRLKDPFVLVLGDADTGVGHADLQHVFVARILGRPAAHVDINGALLGELQGVGHQVAQDLLEPCTVADERRRNLRVDPASKG